MVRDALVTSLVLVGPSLDRTACCISLQPPARHAINTFTLRIYCCSYSHSTTAPMQRKATACRTHSAQPPTHPSKPLPTPSTPNLPTSRPIPLNNHREERYFERDAVLGRDAASVFPTRAKEIAEGGGGGLDVESIKEALGARKFISETEVIGAMGLGALV